MSATGVQVECRWNQVGYNSVPVPFGSGNCSEEIGDCTCEDDVPDDVVCGPDCPKYEEAPPPIPQCEMCGTHDNLAERTMCQRCKAGTQGEGAVYEILNPSDDVTIKAYDVVTAGVFVLLLSHGKYGLNDLEGNEAVPMLMFGGHERWLEERGISDLDEWVKAHVLEVATVAESYAYTKAREREVYDFTMNALPSEAQAEWRAKWNDARRTSLNDIGAECERLARAFRRLATAA